MHRNLFVSGGLLFLFGALCCGIHEHASAIIPNYASPTIFARTGITSWNMPNGSSISSATISVDDDRNVALDVNFVGNTGQPGVFFAEFAGGSPQGQIVFDANDIITGDPALNGAGSAVFTVGFDNDPFVYDSAQNTADAINYPIGVTGSSNLRLSPTDQLSGRLEFGFTGDAYGSFTKQTSGLPALTLYATDNGIDAGSPFSFLYTPDASHGSPSVAPRIAAKVSLAAGFDFEEIHIFDADGSSELVAVETEVDPISPFSEFITNSVTISDDGTQVAFQALDTAEVSGIYRYDSSTGIIDLIASTADTLLNEIDIFSADVNNAGLVAFRGDDSLGRSSVFVGDGTKLMRLAGEGDVLATDLGDRQLGRRDMDSSQSGAPRINNDGDVGFVFQYFDPDEPSSVADGSLVLMMTASISGDFDGNGHYECADIDLLVAAIAAGNDDVAFDLTGDGFVNLVDRDAWLAEAGAAQLASGNAYLLGDANLDGVVDAMDFIMWNDNRFTSVAAWCRGDFNANGVVDAADFIEWNQNRFMSADAWSVSTPEPATSTLLLGLCGMLALRRRLPV